MHLSSSSLSNAINTHTEDEYLFGWDPMPGLVSVCANREGRALIWRREGERITCSRERFRPWVFAATLDDLSHLVSSLISASSPIGSAAIITYRELDGPADAYRFLLSASDGRLLENELVRRASRRRDRKITSINVLP